MSSSSLSSLHPAALPPGTPVGPFRILEWAGRGVHGAVYCAERIGRERLPPVALKLAVLPEDPRYLREQELLSRSHHPHIPRLVGAGLWVSPEGARHPFLAMQWIDGMPLYDWGRMFHPSAQQQLRLLAQAALTLQYLHAQGALHRDFKGDNLLVRRWDSRLFLMDFGSSIYPGADTLTPQQLPPGTPAYRSPEAWLFTLQPRHASERYRAGPADDVFALGVTACVLATGRYPEMGVPRKDEQDRAFLDALKLPRALFSAQVAPPLRELILRMLAIAPKERPTAAELAPALEQAAEALGPSTPSLRAPQPEAGRADELEAQRAPPGLVWRPWLVGAAGALGLWAGALVQPEPPPVREEPPRAAPAVPLSATPDAAETDTAGLGEQASPAPQQTPAPAAARAVAESLPEPSEGQAQPDKKGRCPHPQQVVLNGACWARLRGSREECDAADGQMYQQACYVPVYPGKQGRPSTSGAGRPHPQ
ncbi:serine/threonine-protein kinase [Hyalangium minutum]|uniref:non-specific serine/threonine protein kinase n=1 Tax=Hyalangium minutum TaxID=394096 RepID=A0A085WHV5_9BACT|nr:serine/threonine-protein kinase [Hyalangium minutum]KFE67268.1 hypothetical protein DB31_8621 [Hyalangium minutum]